MVLWEKPGINIRKNKYLYKSNKMRYEMAKRTFNIIIEQGQDGYLISSVIELPGCHTQAKTYDELNERTKEAISLYLEEKKKYRPVSKFVSLQQLSI
jgi:predicted RNase H-like HicB family nuclease